MSLMQGLYLHRTVQANEDQHPCPQWDAYPKYSVPEVWHFAATGVRTVIFVTPHGEESVRLVPKQHRGNAVQTTRYTVRVDFRI
jgi:hypothetical protein